MLRDSSTHRPPLAELWHIAGALAALTIVTAAYEVWLGVSNPTVVGLSYLLIVLLLAAVSTLRVAVAVSVLALLTLNYFFMPPVGTLTLEDPQDWVALLVFMAASVVASRLALVARRRAE
jgi:two-component system sensor histidine kinase KdpD